MTKVSRKPLPKEFGDYVNNLWAAFTLLDTKVDVRLLFKDMYSHTEYKMFAKRLEIARRLLDGQSYISIRQALSVTDATISVVSNILAERGDGYRKVHKKLSDLDEEYRKKESEKHDRMSNPFKYRTKRKTVGGEIIKAGLRALD